MTQVADETTQTQTETQTADPAAETSQETAIETAAPETPPKTDDAGQADQALAAKLGLPVEQGGDVPTAKTDETKPAGEAKDGGKGQEADSLDERHTRLARQLKLSDEDIAERIKKYGVETYSEMVEDAAAAYSRTLNGEKLKGGHKEKGPEGEHKTPETPAAAPAGEKKPDETPAKPPAIDTSKLRIPDDDTYEPDLRDRFNGILDVIDALAKGGTSPEVAETVAYVRAQRESGAKEAAAKAEAERFDAADAYFVKQAAEFPEFGKEPWDKYAEDAAELDLRGSVYDRANEICDLYTKRTGQSKDFQDALDLAFLEATRDRIRNRGQEARKARIAKQRASTAPSGPAGGGRRVSPEQEADEQLQKELEARTGIHLPLHP